MYHIQPSSDPYFSLIAQSITREFPTQHMSSPAALVDIIEAEILGTKQQRYGPKPAPESLVMIRDVIRLYTEQELPIPFLVPWGSLKPNESSVDLAEVWALKMVRCLGQRILGHYPAGAVFNIRLEDASAPNVFFDRMEETRVASRFYRNDFEALVQILELPIAVVRESLLVSEEEFTAEAEKALLPMHTYLENPSNSHALGQLMAMGWRGTIPTQMREFYLGQYGKLYPEDTMSQKLHRLARYLSGSLARKRLVVTAAHPSWGNNYIELSFMPIVPGTESFFGRRVYYRTLPSAITRNHMPPWRAKGYMLISNENELCPKLASFSEPQEYNNNTVTMVNGDNSVTIQADYIVA